MPTHADSHHSSPNLTRRFIISFCGIIIMMGGTAVITLSQLGTAPVSSPVWAVTLIVGLTFGIWTFILNMGLIATQFFMLRPVFPRSGWLQLPALLVSSAALDFWMWALEPLRTDNYVGKLGLVVVGIVILAFGVSLLAGCKLLYLPGEGFVAALSERLRLPFPKVKLRFDLTCLALSLLLSVVFLHSIETVREATILSALSLGPLVGEFLPLSSRLIGPVPNHAD